MSRLIDADRFIEQCNENIACEWNHKAAPHNWAYAYMVFIGDIEMQPTIDAVPREELLNTLNGRLDFLQKWRNETADFKNIATAMIEDCEDIIDIIKSLKENKDG